MGLARAAACAAPQHDRHQRRDRRAGSAVRPSVRLAEIPRHSVASLAVAPDGHALVTLPDRRVLNVAERAPGGAFGAPSPVASLRDPVGTRTAAVLSSGGRGAIAWSGIGLGGVSAITLPGVATALAAPDPRLRYDLFYAANGATLALPLGYWGFDGADDLGIALAGDRALVTWTGPVVDRGLEHLAANAATLPLGGGDRGAAHDRRRTGRHVLLAPAAARRSDPGRHLDGQRLPSSARGRGCRARSRGRDPARPDRPPGATCARSRRTAAAPGSVQRSVRGARPGAGRLARHRHAAAARGRQGQVADRLLQRRHRTRSPGPVRVRFTYGTSDGRATRSRTRTFRLAQRRP